jgi:hypothetical protein
MLRALRISALALLAAIVLIGLVSGAALAGTGDGDPSSVLTQVSLTVQPDLCVGHVTVSLSYDGGYHWEPFIEAPVHGDPSNCDPAALGIPYYNQASITWTPTWDGPGYGEGVADTDRGAAHPPQGPGGHQPPGPGAPTDVLTLTAGPQAGSTRARVASTTSLYPGQSETYWTQFTWYPGGYGTGSDVPELLYGAASNRGGPGPAHRHR